MWRPSHARQHSGSLFVVGLCLILIGASAPDAAGQIRRISVSTSGTQANGVSTSAGISANGRWILLTSGATNLADGVPTDAMVTHYYLVDRSTGLVRYLPGMRTWGAVATISDDGNRIASGPGLYDVTQLRWEGIPAEHRDPAFADSAAYWMVSGATLSADGRYLAFASDQRPFVGGIGSLFALRGIFVRDTLTGAMCEAIGPVIDYFDTKHEAVFYTSPSTGRLFSVSPDGTRVAFAGNGSVLVSGVSGTHPGPFILDCTTQQVSQAQTTDPSGIVGITMSANARFAAYVACGAPSVLHVTDTLTRAHRTREVASPLDCAFEQLVHSVSDDGRYTLVGAAASPGYAWIDVDTGDEKGIDRTPSSPNPDGMSDFPVMSADGRYVAFRSSATNLVPGDTNGFHDAFVRDMFDDDGDGMTNDWERAFGMNPTNAADAALDPDADGATNLQEFTAHTHPRGLASATRYFAEGATSTMFETRFSVANPGTTDASVVLRYLKPDGSVSSSVVEVPAMQSRKITASLEPDMATSEFSTVVESDQPIVADRVMWWSADTAYGTSGERAVTAPAARWFLAEGATHSGFNLFYLLQNPAATDAQVRVRYLLPSGAPLVKSYTVAGRSRFNIWVNLEEFPSAPGNALLANTDVSADIEVLSGPDIVVERAMYLTRSAAAPGGLFEAGHESAGVTATASSWYFAEGATGNMFDLFVLVANPSNNEAQVRATYFLDNGTTYTKDYSVAANSRYNIWVDVEQFDGVAGLPLANVSAVATKLEVLNGVPVVAERAMWWPGPTAVTWSEAHNSPGATITATKWVVADGTVQDLPSATDTYYLIANPTDVAALVKVTVLFADGTASVSREYAVAARSRFNVDMRSAFPQSLGKGFGAIVESIGTGTTPIVVEWAIYNDALGKTWAGGANALATPMPEPDGND